MTEENVNTDKIVDFDIGRDDDDDVDDKAPTTPTTTRRPGRPRKVLTGTAKLAAAMAEQPPPVAASSTGGDSDDAGERKLKTQKISIIDRLQKQLGAVGTGMRPTMFNSIEELNDEIEALNNDLNTKRGDKAVKTATLMIMPLIELLVDRLAPKDKFDLSTYRHLKDEVDDNWEMFEEAATHIAILNAGWFAVTPYHEFVSATYACAISVNAKNQMAKKRGGIMPSVPQNTPDDDNDSSGNTDSQ
jgi:hypothetical protein